MPRNPQWQSREEVPSGPLKVSPLRAEAMCPSEAPVLGGPAWLRMGDARCLLGGEVQSDLFQLASFLPSSLTGGCPGAAPGRFHPISPTRNGSVLTPKTGLCSLCPRSSDPILLILQLLQAIPVGVGQVYGCDNPWTGGVFLVALFISSPLICLHAAIGSIVGLLAGRTRSPFCREGFGVIFLRPFHPCMWQMF